jgi:two-component system NarL family response regulator
MTILVGLADDHRMLREALAGMLAQEPDIVVAGQAGSGPEALEIARRQNLDVLLLDIGMPGMNGVEVMRTLRLRRPSLKVLALSAHADKRFVQEMLKAGAAGYVVKSAAGTELVQAIRAVTRDKLYLSPDIARAALADHLVPDAKGPPPSLLGRREREVLALLAEGMRSREIAARLRISNGTVEAHRRSIKRKLGLRTVAELTRYAVREGLAVL